VFFLSATCAGDVEAIDSKLGKLLQTLSAVASRTDNGKALSELACDHIRLGSRTGMPLHVVAPGDLEHDPLVFVAHRTVHLSVHA
jgi:hypothetical protein